MFQGLMLIAKIATILVVVCLRILSAVFCVCFENVFLTCNVVGSEFMVKQ